MPVIRSLLRMLFAIGFLLSSLFAAPSFADASLGDGLKPDVRLLVDISGSMKDSDPENLRAPALELILKLLPEGAKAGVWLFGEDVELLVEHRVVDDAWHDEALTALAEINNSGQLTNIPAALKAAMYDFDRLDPSYRTSIILLTDGKVDISESPMTNAQAARTLLTDGAPVLGAAGIPVHTIALSDEADWVFLHSLAKTTSGLAERASTAEELTEIFYRSLEMVAPTSRVPIEQKRFKIDSSVREFTALIFTDEKDAVLGLEDPQGERYEPEIEKPGVEWFRNRKFASVTVEQPQAGQWKLIAPQSRKSRVTVISDFLLEVDPLPYSLPAGKRAELGLRLRDHGRVLRDPEVLSVFQLSVDVINPRGNRRTVDVTTDYPIPEDGEYRVFIPGMELPGRYEVIARLHGNTLDRELPMYVEVLASATNSAISTLGEEIPEGDFKKPMLGFGVGAILVLALVMWVLNRRKRQKLEVWRRRNLDMNDVGAEPNQALNTMDGLSAPEEPHDRQS